MDTTKLRTDLGEMLRAARQARADATAAADALEDDTLAQGPVVVGGVQNEEMKQTLDGLRGDLESAIATIRRALAMLAQLEGVAMRYTAASVPHPVVAPVVVETARAEQDRAFRDSTTIRTLEAERAQLQSGLSAAEGEVARLASVAASRVEVPGPMP